MNLHRNSNPLARISLATLLLLTVANAGLTPRSAAASDPIPCGAECGERCTDYSGLFEGSLCGHDVGGTGGWLEQCQSSGYTFNLSTTQFYQGVTSGGIRRNAEWGGRNDYLLNIDGQKAGLWEGFFITLHGESRYGDSVIADTGSVIPPNTALLFPQPNGTKTALTGVKFTQALSEEFITFAGKINTLDELLQPYAGGRGVDAFQNLGLAFPVAVSRTVPYSTLGAGFAVLQGPEPVFSFMVLDTQDSTTTTGFSDLFHNGVTLLAKLSIPVTISDLPGHQEIWGTYSTGTYSDLEPNAYFDPEQGLVIASSVQSGSWSIFYSADQALYVDPCNPTRKIGVFTNLGLADNGPSPIRWSANVGIGGSSPIASRPLDTFGIGYSHVGYSTALKTAAPLLLPFQDNDAVELFYNYAFTPHLRVTPNIQFLTPGRARTIPPNVQNIDNAVVVGLRAKLEY